MYICPNCNKQSETPANFCPRCGTTMIIAPEVQVEAPQTQYVAPQPEQPQYAEPQQPVYAQPQYTQPQYAPQQPQQPMYNQPQYTQPVYNQPQYVAPQPSVPSKAKAIVGMALGAAGLFFAVMGFFYTLMFVAIDGAFAIGMAIGFGIFSMPLSLVGLIMSSKARNAGDISVFTKLGKIFGLVGTIVSGVNLIIGIIGAAVGEEAYMNEYYKDYYDYY